MKKGLVMEGGALRGMFTSGVIDVFMEKGITFDGAIGVSAGAAFGCNYKSEQIGRAIRYNKMFCNDKRYSGWGSWLKTGDFYNVPFVYGEVPTKYDIFDVKVYSENPMEFYVVATDVNSGTPVYKKIMNGDEYDIRWLRASASMPMLSRVVEIDGGEYSDGGMTDSIPLEYFEKIGYDRNVVITTQPMGYVKEPNKFFPILKVACRKYPKLVEAIKFRHIMYNKQLEYIKQAEQEGRAIVIRPLEPLNIKAGEKDANQLERVYQMGKKEGNKWLKAVEKFLG